MLFSRKHSKIHLDHIEGAMLNPNYYALPMEGRYALQWPLARVRSHVKKKKNGFVILSTIPAYCIRKMYIL